MQPKRSESRSRAREETAGPDLAESKVEVGEARNLTGVPCAPFGARTVAAGPCGGALLAYSPGCAQFGAP